MSKPTPAHWKTVAIPAETLAQGYSEDRYVRGLPGMWQIISAAPITEKSRPAPQGMTWVIVAPARVAP